MASYGQCSTVSIQVSASDTSYVQLYQAGFFLIPSGFANVCEWEVTSFTGEVIHEETTSGDFSEQSTVLFEHEIPITDSMNVSLVITNEVEGIICTINDTLYWEETEVLPDVFIGNWSVLSSNGGVEEVITSLNEIKLNTKNITLFPCPADDHFKIDSDQKIISLSIFDLNGQQIASYKNMNPQEKVDISHFLSGVYFVQFWDEQSRSLGMKKLVKM
jgi:hypothetical protein